MNRSTDKIVAWIVIAAVGLVLLGYLYLSFTFGAADHAEVSFQAEQLSTNDIVDDITYDPPADTQPIVDRTIENGTSRSVALRYEPFFSDAPSHQIYGEGTEQAVYVHQAGRFYRIAVSNTAEVETRRPTLELVPVNETEGDILAFENLPTADQHVVREAYIYRVRGCDSGSDRDPPCWRPYSSMAANASILVPTPPADYVRYENRTFELVIRERTVEGLAITYRATQEGNETNAFRRQFVTAVSEDDLTEGERELLEQAIGSGYTITVYRNDQERIPRERFNSLLPKLGLPTLNELDGGHHGSAVRYVEYRGVYYRMKILYADTYA